MSMLARVMFVHFLIFPFCYKSKGHFLNWYRRNRNHTLGDSETQQSVSKDTPPLSKKHSFSVPDSLSTKTQSHTSAKDIPDVGDGSESSEIKWPSLNHQLSISRESVSRHRMQKHWQRLLEIRNTYRNNLLEQRTSFCFHNCFTFENQKRYDKIFIFIKQYFKRFEKLTGFDKELIDSIYVGFMDQLFARMLRTRSKSFIDNIYRIIIKPFLDAFNSQLEPLFLHPTKISQDELIKIVLDVPYVKGALTYMSHRISESSWLWKTYMSDSVKIRSLVNFINFLFGDDTSTTFYGYVNREYYIHGIEYINFLHQRIFDLRLDSVIIMDLFSENPDLASYLFLICMLNDDIFISIRSDIERFHTKIAQRILNMNKNGDDLLKSCINDRSLELLRENKLSERSMNSIKTERNKLSSTSR